MIGQGKEDMQSRVVIYQTEDGGIKIDFPTVKDIGIAKNYLQRMN